ncbi:MAG TPA: D-2-hydroxyacid dehydrogenase [Ramlibacter sp.]|nr:D-2-hydroxyacid dehydrogenase [Ramlibacter sp.]
MSELNIVFLDRQTIPPEASLRPLNFKHKLTVYEHTQPAEVRERIADADIVITNKAGISAEALQGAPRLRLVAVAATGTDNVDVAACRTRGVVVSNVRNYAVDTVPEHTFALMFAMRRNIVAFQRAVHAGRWQASGQFCFFDYPIRAVAGSTLAIIGDGALGQAVASRARALGMRVLFAGRKGRTDQGALYTPFEQALAQADVLTLHCPLTPATRHMIGQAEFARMKRGALLINTARGGLVDEDSVGPALDAGHIGGAAFDVVSVEPPPVDHPFMKLLDRPNFILTPHVAWANEEAVQALADQLMDNIETFVRGEPRNIVTA